MNFIEKAKKTTELNRVKIRTRDTKKIIKKIKKKIRHAAKAGQYETTYRIPSAFLPFYESNVEYYFTKEGFICSVYRRWDEYLVSVSWKEKEYPVDPIMSI